MIISYAGTICMHIRNIASIIDRDGALNYGNISSVSNDIQSMTSVKEKMESEITLLSQSKIQKLYLPWIDGRNIPFNQIIQLFFRNDECFPNIVFFFQHNQSLIFESSTNSLKEILSCFFKKSINRLSSTLISSSSNVCSVAIIPLAQS